MILLMMAIESLDGCDFANIDATVHVERTNGDLVVVVDSLNDEKRYKFDRTTVLRISTNSMCRFRQVVIFEGRWRIRASREGE